MATRNATKTTSFISNDNQRSGAFKKLMMTSALTAASVIGIVGMAYADTPLDGTTVYGNSTTTQSGNVYTTNQSTNIAISEYNNSILLKAIETWNINQPDAGSLSAHRVLTFDADPTRILGALNSNGRVLIIDPNGVFFGANSTVDVAGIVTTTGDIDNAQIIGNEFGDYEISGIDSGSIDIRGSITVDQAGLAAFVAPTVRNAGVITAKLGKVVMASGEKVTLDLYGDQLVEIEVAGGADNFIQNTANGQIIAEGGEIHMTAAAAKNAVDNIINVNGIVSASSATEVGGKIVLGGGDAGVVRVTGDLDARGTSGGDIKVSGQNVVVAEQANIRTNALSTGNGEGGNVEVVAADTLRMRGNIYANGGENGGQGGDVTLDGADVLFTGQVDVRSRSAGDVDGTLHIKSDLMTIGGVDAMNRLSSEKVGDQLGLGNLVISARNELNVGDGADVDVSYYEVDRVSFDRNQIESISGTTQNKLTLGSDSVVKINDNLTIGEGELEFVTPTIDLDGQIFGFNGAATLLDNSKIASNATTVNIVSNQALINQGIDVVVAGGTLNIGAGIYEEGNINIDKNLLISGAGKDTTVLDATGFANGFIINSDLGNTNTTIRRLSVNNASQAGLRVSDTANLKVLSLNQTSFANNGNNGVAINGTGVKATNILNSDFLDNGNNNSGNLGRGDVLFYGYNGDITLTNVTIEGNTDDFDYGGWKGVAPRASYGVQVYGTGTDASGEINLDNVKISGNYRAALLGIQKYDGADITLNDVVLGGQTSDGTDSAVTFGSLYLSELNDTVDIGNTAFLAIDDNTPGVAGQYIAVGVEAGSPTVIATNASFEGVVGNTATLAQSFAIEDKVEHDMDRNDHGFTGHVIWQNANEYFVTENNLGIQRAVDLASTGGLINVNSGTYAENVNINKDGLSILGTQAGVDARRRYGAIETVLEGYIKTGTIDGLTIDGFRIENQGDDVAGYGGKGSINLGNNASNVTIKNTIIDGNGQVGHGIVTSSAGANNIRIEKNLFTDNSYGVYVNPNHTDVVIVSNRFDGNRYGVITQDGGANTRVNGNTFINNTRAGVLAWSANGAPSTIGTMNNNQFRDNEQHIAHWDGNGADISIEAETGNKFYVNGAYKLVSEMTTEELFALEDKITHDMDNAGYGHVIFGGGDLFVTSNTLGIQNAINLAAAGATVNVDNSTYTEDLIIDKALKLTGHGTTLQSAGGANLITVTAANVNIDPFTFDGLGLASYGVYADGADGLIVDGNTFLDFTVDAIHVENSDGILLTGNTTDGTGSNGIAVVNSDNGFIQGNTVKNAGHNGIAVIDSNNVTVNLANIIDGTSSAGVAFNRTTNSIVDGNDISNTGGSGVWIKDADGSTVSNNTIDTTWLNGSRGTGSGVHVISTTGATVSGNTIDNVTRNGSGVFADDSAGIDIDGNFIGTNGAAGNISGDGVHVENSANANVNGNQIEEAQGYGVYVSGSDNAVIGTSASSDRNTIKNIDLDGIKVSGGTGVSVENNDVSNVGRVGIYAEHANNLTITGNEVDNTTFDIGIPYGGITTDWGSNITISNNRVTNSGHGVMMYLVGGTNSVSGNHIDDVTTNGVNANQVSGLTISGNFIGRDGGNVGGDGIHVENSADAEVLSNTISDAAGHGIFVSLSEDVLVEGNTIKGTNARSTGFLSFAAGKAGAGLDGIHIENSNGTKILGNTIAAGQGLVVNFFGSTFGASGGNGANGNGIFVSGSDFAQIDGNFVNPDLLGNGLGAGQDGIHVENSNMLLVGGLLPLLNGNKIFSVGDDGIDISGSNGVAVLNNLVSGATILGIGGEIGDDGIVLDGTIGAIVAGNIVSHTGDNGIKSTNGALTAIGLNVISNVGDDGIDVSNSAGVYVGHNTITDSAENGIQISGLLGGLIKDNTISGSGEDGIHAASVTLTSISDNEISDSSDDGIDVEGANWLSIKGNTVSNSYDDGIRVADFGKVTIKNNDVDLTGDDAIEAKGGDDVTITGNSIFGAGFYADNASWSGADGIRVKNVTDSDIRDNTIAFTGDDGIEVVNGETTNIEGNILGHIGHNASDADGIRAVDVAHTVVKYNGIADVLDDGIRIKGGAYAGVFGNKILMAGDEGIEVSGIGYGDIIDTRPDLVLADIDYPTVGYAVSIEDNEVVLTGDNGIYVHNSDSARIVNNDVLFAGAGEWNVYNAVNQVADEISFFLSGPASFGAPAAFVSIVDTIEDYEPSFGMEWGNGDGIKVENIHRELRRPDFEVFSTTTAGFGPYPEYGDWTVLVQGNDVSWTGGNGISVTNAGTTLIGGHSEGEANTVDHSGVNFTVVSGFDSFRDWVESGPFADEESRRVVWWGEDMTADLEGYLTADISEIGYGAHDGIRAMYINNNGYFGPVGEVISEEPSEHGYYGYALNIIGNNVSTTGDDGISASYSSSALIQNNVVNGAGVGISETPDEPRSYGSGDFFGADGIFAYNIYGERAFAAGSYTDGYEEYALVIDGNVVNRTDDDGIEVAGAGRTLIVGNNVTEAGIGGGYLYEGGGIFGSDGIHARDVYDHTFPIRYSVYEGGPVSAYDYALQIVGNTVDTTADDGVQVLFSDNTLIAGNTISNSGNPEGAAMFGGDGIHVMTFGEYGYEGEGYTRVDILNNNVTNSLDDGVEVAGINIDLQVNNNTISGAGDVGVNAKSQEGFFLYRPRIEEERPTGFNSTITNNTITDAENFGIFVEGEGHNSVVVAGNTVTDSAVGARFESGAVDISNLDNPNSFINTNPLGLPVGLQFDGNPENLTIVGQTIGATNFDGFLNAGSFYVRFEDGSILDTETGSPLLINGLDATFDGFSPSLFIPPEILAFLEARIYDADDATVNGRGQLFVGFPLLDSFSIENIEDFFRNFGAFNSNAGRASVTIAGLPSLGNFGGGNNAPSANFFANIEPAAGGESTDPNDLANLEPAAGGEETESSCWGDAVNAASNGQVSSFTFGGSFEASIAQEAGCQSASAQ